MELKGKVGVVTGGASGIGLATVRRFAEEGANVIFCGRRKEKGEQIQREIEAENYPGQVCFFQCDVSKPEQVEALANFTLEKFGPCEVLFNSAGVHSTGRVHEISLEEWNHCLSVDLQGVFLCCHYFVPQMLAQKYGTIINCSSVSGLAGDYNTVAYSAAKGAVTNLTRSMALDYGLDGIRVNAVCPGVIASEMTGYTFECSPEVKEKFLQAYPLHYIADPVNVANTCVFPASRKADFINGANIPIDGGILAHTGEPFIPTYPDEA